MVALGDIFAGKNEKGAEEIGIYRSVPNVEPKTMGKDSQQLEKREEQTLENLQCKIENT